MAELPSAQPEQRWIPVTEKLPEDYGVYRITWTTWRWIPVSERLPEEGQKCLVCDKGTIDIDTFYGWAEPYLWSTYLAEYEAWMPLPEPYAERRSE